jgi:hypothetical protein
MIGAPDQELQASKLLKQVHLSDRLIGLGFGSLYASAKERCYDYKKQKLSIKKAQNSRVILGLFTRGATLDLRKNRFKNVEKYNSQDCTSWKCDHPRGKDSCNNTQVNRS